MVGGTHVSRAAAELREAVIALAAEAGQAVMTVYAQDFAVEQKADDSPVTAADLLANRIIIAGLQALTPDLPVLSEESAQVGWDVRRHWRRFWLVDPIDGTREFVKRNGQFSVNIALIEEGEPVLGVVQAPVDGRVWHAVSGQGACLRADGRDQPLQVRQPATAPLQVAVSRSLHSPRGERLLARMGQVETLRLGSSLKFCRIAEGAVDVYPRLGQTSEWDTGAGQCVLEAAGGQVLCLHDGRPFRYNQRKTLLNGEFIALGDASLPWQQWRDDSESDA